MKQKTTQTRSRWLLATLLSLLMTLGGTSPAWAQTVTVYEEATNTNAYVPIYGYYTDAWLKCEFIIPSSELTGITSGKKIHKMKFYASADKAFTGTFQVFMKEVGSDVNMTAFRGTEGATIVYEGTLTVANKELEIVFTSDYQYNGANLLVGVYEIERGNSAPSGYNFTGKNVDNQSAWQGYSYSSLAGVTGSGKYFIPKTTFTCAIEGPGFEVKDGSTTIESPFAYNFGLAESGDTKTFTLSNPGTVATPISVDVSGANGFTAAVEDNATSIPAGGEKTLTITMPDATASGSIVVTPSGAGLSAFTFNVSGTKRDPNKVYLDFSDGQMPDGWTSEGYSGYSSYDWTPSVGYISYSASSSSCVGKFVSPKLNFENGELIAFETKKYGTPDYYNPSVTVEYTTDATGATGWTAIGSAFTDDTYGTWTKRSVNIPIENVKRIRFKGWYVHLRNIYGGELPNEPKMVVTEPATLNFGTYEKDASPAPTKTFTIANTGLATLNGISVASGNAAFTITNAPTSLAAGASQDVTITMSTATAGNLSSLITVSATDMVDATFTVTGQVLPSGLSVIDFNNNQLPARWENTGWTFSNGAAYAAYHNPAYVMTTPKIEMGDFLVIKGKIEYNSSSYYVTVKGLDVNDDEVYSKKLTNDVFNNEEYKYAILNDIPSTVKKLQFVGYYGYIDEIQGINYAPTLSVTTGDPAATVNTPADYDFGECAANANVTYNFANVGGGTINITNVAITGTGAAAYSTNWTTSVAAPFDLVITRTYDAGRAGEPAMEAVVTVTTSEGNFVINVSGTDKAADAPELAVSTNAINFGKVTANAVETVTVTNNGTGSMDVTIASNSDDFEVSTASLTSIGAGASKTFNITFKYGTPYGVKNGNVTVTPSYDAGAAQVITVTGKAKDPATWSEDFSGGTLPAGWEAGTDWTIADGKAKGAYAYSSTTYLTTAPLTVSGTTDELTFDYITTAGNVSINIQKSKDGGEWTSCVATPAIPTYMSNGTAGTATITGLEAGTYQFRFANDDYNLDNFEGFVLNLPDHMMAITASTIPTSGLKEGQSFNAYVTVKEKRGVAETGVIAKLYMNSVVIGTSTATDFEANESKQITIPCTPTTGADDASMYIEVIYAGTETVSTTPVVRDVAAITNLTLDEGSSAAISAGTYDNLTLVRQFTAGWNTVCLPFTISDVEAFFGTGAKAYRFSGFTNGDLEFTTTSSLTASYPYIVYVPSAITEDIELHDITIAAGDVTAFYQYQSGAYFRGTYIPIAAGNWTKNAGDDKLYGVTAAGKIAKIGGTATSKGFRGYFDLPDGATARLSFYDETTGITTVMDAKELSNDGKVYNLNGQRVENAHKGLYIVNGKKVVVK